MEYWLYILFAALVIWTVTLTLQGTGQGFLNLLLTLDGQGVNPTMIGLHWRQRIS